MITDPHTAQAVHYLLEWAALAAGLLVYRAGRKRRGEPGLLTPGPFAVTVGALIGAAVGSKLSFWLDNPQLWGTLAGGPGAWLRGQSVVGGLLGGWLGVEAGKRISRISARTGDDYVAPILVGLAIGRAGCFLAGLHDGTCGLPTTLPWGVDFGDGAPRHPVQIYESLLALLTLATWPRWRTAFARTPGLAFRALLLGYLVWRVAVDTLKPVPFDCGLGLSGLQWICILAALSIAVGLARDIRSVPHA